MSLFSLTYLSSAVRCPTGPELAHLLGRARERNATEGITGVLLYSEGAFIQCIEGPQAGVDTVFGIISRDPLHHKILELYHEPIAQREYGEWLMAYRATGAPACPDGELAHRLTAPPGTLSASRHLLASFWNGGLGARYRTLVD